MLMRIRSAACVLALCLCLTSCMPAASERNVESRAPAVPERLALNEAGVPLLRVYDTESKSVKKMDAEAYLAGVLAGEMRSDWPMEALKAQAILARTFVMQFVGEKTSKYQGADISTDVSEAQAYDAAGVNERVRQAVAETRGLVVCADGKLIHAWFHAHAGGETELASVGLDYDKGDPAYIAPVDSPDSDKAPEGVKNWQAAFTAAAVEKACSDAGVRTGPVERIEIDERGASGRVVRFQVNGKSVSAPALRIHLDASRLKSTLIDSVELQGGQVIFAGRGYGHGVGLSQWGAYALAEQGEDAEAIIRHYFRGVEIVPMWN